MGIIALTRKIWRLLLANSPEIALGGVTITGFLIFPAIGVALANTFGGVSAVAAAAGTHHVGFGSS
ncbi:hypothetical protein L218DRAFT_957120 [Marasmius fiardii PR-910]|nr:hypothetical protein L218DRAFT_957120 [Marasmius fiardii PR-910]